MAMNTKRLKLILILVVLVFFIVGFVLNITSDQSLYNEDLNIVPDWQTNTAMSSPNFMSFMNVISILFDPPICAAYLAIFWLISSRRLEIMVFLIWFIFMSWVLSILKSAIHQPRPFWQYGSGIVMESWTCYTQFGCPSGHSWMGLVLMEYIVRFYARWYPRIKRNIVWFYILIVLLQCTVMLSRVILGMHTFNQVLMGAMLGIFTICLYYLYVQKFIIKFLEAILNINQGKLYLKSKTESQRRGIFSIILLVFVVIVVIVDLVVYFAIDYQNEPYWSYIKTISGCESVVLVKSFQYRCLEDSAIVMAGVGIVLSLIFTKDPSIFVRPLSYTRLSLKFVGRFILFIVLAAIPLAAFLNPGWSKIDVDVSALAVILWVCQMLGFMFALMMLLLVGPLVGKYLGLQEYGDEQYQALIESKDEYKRSIGLIVDEDLLLPM